MTDDIVISRARVEDAPAILALIRRAFAPVAEFYGDPELPPLTETEAENAAMFATHTVLKATDASGVIVGTVRGNLEPDGTCLVGRLAVEPDRQGAGIARALTIALEAEFPQARCFRLFTGHLSVASLGLYSSLGYRETGRTRADDRLTLVWLEKAR